MEEIYRLMKRVARHAAYTILLWPYILCGVRSMQTRYSSLITRPLSQIFSLDFTCAQNYMGAVTWEAYSRTADKDTAEDPPGMFAENIRYSIIIRNWISFFAILSSRVILVAKCAALKKERGKSRYRTNVQLQTACFFPSYLFARIMHIAKL